MKLKVISVILFFSIIIISCDHGTEPPKENKRTAISGTITYHNWPPADSLKDLRLIAFKSYPPVDIFFEVTNGQAIVYPPIGASEGLPFNVDLYNYTMDIPAGTYEYLVVAQQYGESITTDWRAVGQYDTTGTGRDSIPTGITISQNQVLKDIDIDVDFKNLPYQPFVD